MAGSRRWTSFGRRIALVATLRAGCGPFDPGTHADATPFRGGTLVLDAPASRVARRMRVRLQGGAAFPATREGLWGVRLDARARWTDPDASQPRDPHPVVTMRLIPERGDGPAYTTRPASLDETLALTRGGELDCVAGRVCEARFEVVFERADVNARATVALTWGLSGSVALAPPALEDVTADFAAE